MKRRPFIHTLAVCAGIAVLSAHVSLAAGPSPSEGKADWIYKGGLVYTVDAAHPRAEAVAVRGDRIVFVGSAKEVEAWRGPTTRAVDLAGGMLMPGFIDSHDHLATLGVTKLGMNIGGISGKDNVIKAIRQWVAKQPANATLRGFSWALHDTFGEDYPRREWLDEAAGARPMYVMSADMHETWFNTAAMKKAGLSKSTPDPDPGKQYYTRDADGTPSGLAVEGASLSILLAMGFGAHETVLESQHLTIDVAPSFGMTSYLDCGFLLSTKSGDSVWVMDELVKRDKAGKLPLRVVASVYTRSPSDGPKAILDELLDWKKRFQTEHVQMGPLKMWTDGTFIGGSAKLLEPFVDGSKGGEMFFTPKEAEAQIEAAQKAGIDVHVHADGDATVRIILDAMESVQKRLGVQGQRNTICHMSLVHPSDLPRFQKLGIIVNGTPLWATDYNGVDYNRYTRLLGAKRFDEELMPYGDMVRSGATFTIGADLGGVDIPEIAPLLHIEAAVTRQRPGHPNDNIMVKRQRMKLEDALKAYTINGAYQLRIEDQVGSIAVGKKADLVFLQKDLFKVPTYEIHSTKVMQTMMDGKVTHSVLK
jgi:predicted amidohydrolase YtcJ